MMLITFERGKSEFWAIYNPDHTVEILFHKKTIKKVNNTNLSID